MSTELTPTIWLSQRCAAVVEGTDGELRDCERQTTRGTLCWQHGIELLGLRVKKSGIEDAGLGLFTTRSRKAREIVDEYRGEVISQADFDRHPSAYGVAVSQGRIVNPIRSTDCLARFSNDARTARKNNCELISDRQYGIRYAKPRYTDGSGAKVYLITKRAVAAGSELLTSYGNAYWSEE